MTTFLILLCIGLVIAVPITLFVFAGKFRLLEWRMRRIEEELARLRSGSPLPVSDAPVAPLGPVQQPISSVTASPLPPPPVMQRAAAPHPSIPEKPRAQVAPSRTQQEWEELVGGKLLNRIGALALIIGVGFFLKYAFDNNWISETMRVLMGGALGFGLLLLGRVGHKKGLAVFSQGILGAGIAILYLSVYASFNFYHLVSQPFAFALMAVVTAIAFWQGIRYDSLAIALLGWTGGFLTPFLLQSDHPNAVGLLSYLTALNMGVLAIVAFKRNWTLLHGMSLIATYLIYFTWHDQYGESLSWPITALFLSLWLIAFLASELLAQVKQVKQIDLLRGASAANLIFYALSIHIQADLRVLDTECGIITLIVVALYLGIHFVTTGQRLSSEQFRVQYAISAVAMLALSTLDFLDDYWMVIAWSIEALVVFWWGVQKQSRQIWVAGLCFLFVSAIGLLLQDNTMQWQNALDFRLLFHERALAMVVFALCLATGSLIASKQLRSDTDKAVAPALTIGWTAIIFLMLTVETTDYLRRQALLSTGSESITPEYLRSLILAAIWSLYSLPLIWFGIQRRSETYAIIGVISIAVATLTALVTGFNYSPITEFHLFFNIRFAVFILIVASLLISGRLMSHWREPVDQMKHLAAGLYLGALGLLLFLFTAETWNGFDRLREIAYRSSTDLDKLSRLVDLQQLTLSGVWLVFSIVLMVLGLWKRTRLLRIVAIALFGITILKIFIYDLSFLETLYRIFSFIGLGVILLAVSYLYQRYKGIILDLPGAGPKVPEGIDSGPK
ncbi:MAG: DUF2339 domain-containing protein [bacterium]|nr:DUF2339 domain-containing protein [bacterium]